MTGFEASVKRVRDLAPGDRVHRFETYMEVQSVTPADDGSGHLIVMFQDAPTSRYAAGAEVVVLDIEKGEAPDESH